METCKRVIEICKEVTADSAANGVELFDAIVARLIEENIVVNQAATQTVRANSANYVVVYEDHGELDVVEMGGEGNFESYEYSEDYLPCLIPAHDALEYFGSERLTENDLESLRFVMRDGVKFYEENDVYCIYKKKVSERQNRFEEWRTASFDLPDEFLELCEKYGVNPLTVLRGFVADVCGIVNYVSNPRSDGYSSNGSDERDMAEQYFDRAHWCPEVEEKHGISYHY